MGSKVVIGIFWEVVVGIPVLHKCFLQHLGPVLMVLTFCMNGRLRSLAAAAHRLVDEQPKTGVMLEPLVTVEDK